MLLRRLARRRTAILGITLVLAFAAMAVLAPWLAPHDPQRSNVARRLSPPSQEYLLGTDSLGRDLLSRIIFGARFSVATGVVSVGIALMVGTVLGLVAGYTGGLLDDLVMRSMDVLLAFPGILLAIGVVAVLGPGLVNAMIAIGISRVPNFARVIRGTTLVLREQEYVQASLVAGARTARVMFRHVLPNALSPLIVLTTLNLGTALLTASSLGFLGLGAQPPTPEWGAMLSDGRLFLLVAPHVATFPGVAIALMVLAFNLVGDGLRDALDPRLKDVGRRE